MLLIDNLQYISLSNEHSADSKTKQIVNFSLFAFREVRKYMKSELIILEFHPFVGALFQDLKHTGCLVSRSKNCLPPSSS